MPSQKPTKRLLQLNEEIREIFALLIAKKEIKDPRVSRITVQSVLLSPDLSIAKIYFSLLNSADKDAAMEGLKVAKPFLRKQLSQKLSLRRTPDLVFYYDDSQDRYFKMQGLIRQARDDDKLDTNSSNETADENKDDHTPNSSDRDE